MTNALTVYDRIANPYEFVTEMGKAIARSQMFQCENESQGQVLALACITNRCDPLSIPQSFHLMHGRLTLRADAMLGRLSKAGGVYEVIEHSPDAAEIRLEYKGRKYHERFTWEEAQQEPFVYQGKPKEVMPKLLAGKASELQLSTNYATPRRRMQHLWARVVSDAVRVVAPELVTGVYTPDENHVALIEDGRVTPSAPMVDQPESSEATEAVDAEFTAAPVVESPARATGEQIRQLTARFQQLGIPVVAQLAAFKKRGATDMGDLSQEAAAELLESLEAKIAATMEGESKASDAVVSGPSNGPASEEQINAIRALVKQIAQQDGGVEIANQLKAGLAAQGMKLADLSRTEAAELERALAAKNLETFFQNSLAGHSPEESEKND